MNYDPFGSVGVSRAKSRLEFEKMSDGLVCLDGYDIVDDFHSVLCKKSGWARLDQDYYTKMLRNLIEKSGGQISETHISGTKGKYSNKNPIQYYMSLGFGKYDEVDKSPTIAPIIASLYMSSRAVYFFWARSCDFFTSHSLERFFERNGDESDDAKSKKLMKSYYANLAMFFAVMTTSAHMAKERSLNGFDIAFPCESGLVLGKASFKNEKYFEDNKIYSIPNSFIIKENDFVYSEKSKCFSFQKPLLIHDEKMVPVLCCKTYIGPLEMTKKQIEFEMEWEEIREKFEKLNHLMIINYMCGPSRVGHLYKNWNYDEYKSDFEKLFVAVMPIVEKYIFDRSVIFDQGDPDIHPSSEFVLKP